MATLSDAAWSVRQRTRVLGRQVYSRSVSTPLLIKGLEFDHAIVLNANELTNKELYVALTRGFQFSHCAFRDTQIESPSDGHISLETVPVLIGDGERNLRATTRLPALNRGIKYAI